MMTASLLLNWPMAPAPCMTLRTCRVVTRRGWCSVGAAFAAAYSARCWVLLLRRSTVRSVIPTSLAIRRHPRRKSLTELWLSDGEGYVCTSYARLRVPSLGCGEPADRPRGVSAPPATARLRAASGVGQGSAAGSSPRLRPERLPKTSRLPTNSTARTSRPHVAASASGRAAGGARHATRREKRRARVAAAARRVGVAGSSWPFPDRTRRRRRIGLRLCGGGFDPVFHTNAEVAPDRHLEALGKLRHAVGREHKSAARHADCSVRRGENVALVPGAARSPLGADLTTKDEREIGALHPLAVEPGRRSHLDRIGPQGRRFDPHPQHPLARAKQHKQHGEPEEPDRPEYPGHRVGQDPSDHKAAHTGERDAPAADQLHLADHFWIRRELDGAVEKVEDGRESKRPVSNLFHLAQGTGAEFVVTTMERVIRYRVGRRSLRSRWSLALALGAGFALSFALPAQAATETLDQSQPLNGGLESCL